MIPCEFVGDGKSVLWAENQPEYLPLPSIVVDNRTITKWKLNWKERFWLFFTGVLWHEQLNFSQPLQAIRMGVEKPKELHDSQQ